MQSARRDGSSASLMTGTMCLKISPRCLMSAIQGLRVCQWQVITDYTLFHGIQILILQHLDYSPDASRSRSSAAGRIHSVGSQVVYDHVTGHMKAKTMAAVPRKPQAIPPYVARVLRDLSA